MIAAFTLLALGLVGVYVGFGQPAVRRSLWRLRRSAALPRLSRALHRTRVPGRAGVVAIRHELGGNHRYAVDVALTFAVVGPGRSAAADATQLAVGAETAARWTEADATLRTVLASDAASLLWLGDALTNLSRVAFGPAVGAAALPMWSAGSRVWRVTGVLGLVAGVGALVSSFALAASGLEIVGCSG